MNETRENLINNILQNPVYSADSGMIQQLKKALSGVSVSNLRNLQLVLQLQRDGATRKPRIGSPNQRIDAVEALRTIRSVTDKWGSEARDASKLRRRKVARNNIHRWLNGELDEALKAVEAHALKNYEKGWDIVVETATDAGIVTHLGEARTSAGWISQVCSGLMINERFDRYQDIRNA